MSPASPSTPGGQLAVREPQIGGFAHFGLEPPVGGHGLAGLFPNSLAKLHDGAPVSFNILTVEITDSRLVRRKSVGNARPTRAGAREDDEDSVGLRLFMPLFTTSLSKQLL
ncbi:hypothetical protein [Streptomyces sp. NPDC056255]|uniref:hypothetical protein n=1 Tax=Streptomyces sp. NPDC056255 TaxID=3345764 RepID=UPI0035E2812B